MKASLRELQDKLAPARQAILKPQQQTKSEWRHQNGGLLRHQLRRSAAVQQGLFEEVERKGQEAYNRNAGEQKEQQPQLMYEKHENHEVQQEMVIERVRQQHDTYDQDLEQTRQDKKTTECYTRLEGELLSSLSQRDQQVAQEEATAENQFCQTPEESEQDGEEKIHVDGFIDCREQPERELQSMSEKLQEQEVQNIYARKSYRSRTSNREQLDEELQSMRKKLEEQEVQHREDLRKQQEELQQELEKMKQEASVKKA
ncbi:golgin subfamily A member 6-like protein 26 [Ochotona princeps]|uniref:golgin subfamily A member 6-like protein 26 n=1 Tax=Ochotona princeps TaxID=9978 RepID=UPI0027152E03|nr:golgin subfamily A member 6-like protein 26 [Ochotona princeps]